MNLDGEGKMRYLVIPKHRTAAVQNISSIHFDPDNRLKQKDALTARRQKEEAASTARSWLKEMAGDELEVIATSEERTPVTGISVIDISPDMLARAKSDLGQDADLVPDYPLELIRPEKVSGTHTRRTSSLDLWHLDAIGLLRARQRPEYELTGKDVTVAILDTGVKEVAEIKGKVAGAYDLNVDNWSVIPRKTSKDTDGHGTHVAGLVCGKNVGVAPDAKVANVIMIPQGSGNLSNFILAMEWVAQQPEISILNMSAGIPGFVPGMESALTGLIAAGVLPVIAIGNEGKNTSRSPGNYRAAFSVGATNRHDAIASFSGGGQMFVDNMVYAVPDLVSPGADVTSCVMGGGYEAWNGTSMATPIVSGIASLYLEEDPLISLSDLSDKVLDSVKDLGFPVSRQGAGLAQVP